MSAVEAVAGQPPAGNSRSPWIAALFGFLLPGLGHLYVGNARRCFALFAAFFAVGWLLLAWTFGLLPRFWILAAIVVAWLGVFLFAIIDPVMAARHDTSFAPKRYNRWWIYPIAYVAGALFWLHAMAAPVAYVMINGTIHQGPHGLFHKGHFTMPSGSMEPTLRPGETFIADNTYYDTHQPNRGDVVVVLHPKENTVYVKRIVALPGDRIQVIEGRAIVNGTALNEPYIRVTNSTAAINNTTEVTVPAGHVFVLGDNRGNSRDSRSAEFGPMPIANFVGRAADIVFSRELMRVGRWIGTPGAH